MEVDTFRRLALRLEYLTPDQAQYALAAVAEIASMLSALRLKLQAIGPRP